MASSILGFLRVNLAMDSAQFGLGARAARADLAAIGAAAKATALAVAGFGVALSAMAISSAETAVNLQGMANGANASMEEFQRAAAAAKIVGIETEQLSDIYRDVNDRVGDFLTTGGGEMADFFEQIAPKVGVTAEQFRKLSGPESLQLFVTSLEQAGVGQQEMIFYLESMASDASKLLPLLANGGAEMNRLGSEAARFGFLNEQAAASGREMREAMILMGAAVTSVGAALANSGIVDVFARVVRSAAEFVGLQVAPALRSMAEALAAAFDEAAPLGSAIATLSENLDRVAVYLATVAGLLVAKLAAGLALSVFHVLALVRGMALLRFAIIRTGIGALIVGAGELVYRFTKLVDGAGGVGAALGLLGGVVAGTFKGMLKEVSAVADGWRAFGEDLKAIWFRVIKILANAWSDFVNRVGVTFNAISKRAGSALRIDGVEVGAWASSFDAAVIRAEAAAERLRAGKLEKLKGAWDEQTAAIKAVQDAYVASADEGEDASARLAAGVREVNAALGDGGGGEGKPGKAEKPSKFRAEIDEAAKSLKSLQQDIETTISGSFSRAFDGLVDGTMKFRDALKGLALDLLKLAGNKLIQSLVGNALGAAFGSIGSAAPATSPIPTPRPFAVGTQFAPGGLSLVGERGPELLNLPQGAQVIPNHRLPSGGMTIHVDARGASDPAAIEAAVRRAVPPIAAAISRETVQDMQRRRRA
ncbi:MAG: hypothetical protein ACI9ZH_001909 [Paracoccaceae bacterium]|jgi:hypothetical protein